MVLTPAGTSLLADARTFLAHSKEALERARAMDNGPAGELRVGIIKGYERSNLGDMLYGFHAYNPSARLSFMRDNVPELYDALKAEKIVVAINLLYHEDKMGSLQWAKLRDYPLYAVVPANHPLAQLPGAEELDGYSLVDIHRGGGGYGENEVVSDTLASAGLNPRVSYVSEDVETSVLCVAAGLGYALLPGYLTERFPPRGKVVAVPIEGRERDMHVVAAWLPTRKNELLDVFLDEFLTVD